MTILKRIGAWFCALLLLGGLIGFAWSFVGHNTIRDKETVKGWVEKAGIYDNIVDTVLETAAQDTSERSGDDISTDNPIIQQSVDAAFTPEFLRSQTESVLDSAYAWLDGSAEKLAFAIELGEAKETFIQSASTQAAERAAELPQCTSLAQAQDYDPIEATCVPPGYDASAVEAEVRKQLTGNDEFFEKTSFSATDIKVGDSKQPFADSREAANLRRAYQYGGYAMWIFVALAIVGLVGLVFLSPRKLFGIRRAGGTFLSAGVVLGVSWVFLRIAQNISTKDISTPADNEASKNLLANLMSVVAGDIASLLLWFVIGYAVIGIALLVVAGIKKHRETPTIEQDEDPEPPANDSPKSEGRAKGPEPPQQSQNHLQPSKKPPRKIQL